MAREQSIQIIVNPASGGSSGRHVLAMLRSRLEAEGYAVEAFVTSGPGEAASFAKGLVSQPDRKIIVIGGDGTVREVATSLDGPGTPIVIYPMGTENLIARYFQMQKDVDALIERLRGGHSVPIDVGEARLGPKAVEKFILVAGVGFDAEVVRRLVLRRRGHISHQDYFWPLWRSFWEYHHPMLRVATEEGVVFEGYGMVFVGNIPRYAVGLKIVPRANPQDGRLDVCVLPCSRRSTLIRHACNVLLGRHPETPGVIYRQATRVSVSTPGHVAVEMDGDLADSQCRGATAMEAVFAPTGRQVSFLATPGWRV